MMKNKILSTIIKMKNKLDTHCDFWKELDDDFVGSYEYCRVEKKRCSCCGEITQCTYRWQLKKKEK